MRINIIGAPGSGKTVFAAQLYTELLTRGEASVELITEEISRVIRNRFSIPIGLEEQLKATRTQYDKEFESMADFTIVESPHFVGAFYEEHLYKTNCLSDLALEDVFNGDQYINIFLHQPIEVASASHRLNSTIDPNISGQLLDFMRKWDLRIDHSLIFDYDLREKFIVSLCDRLIQERDELALGNDDLDLDSLPY